MRHSLDTVVALWRRGFVCSWALCRHRSVDGVPRRGSGGNDSIRGLAIFLLTFALLVLGGLGAVPANAVQQNPSVLRGTDYYGQGTDVNGATKCYLVDMTDATPWMAQGSYAAACNAGTWSQSYYIGQYSSVSILTEQYSGGSSTFCGMFSGISRTGTLEYWLVPGAAAEYWEVDEPSTCVYNVRIFAPLTTTTTISTTTRTISTTTTRSTSTTSSTITSTSSSSTSSSSTTSYTTSSSSTTQTSTTTSSSSTSSSSTISSTTSSSSMTTTSTTTSISSTTSSSTISSSTSSSSTTFTTTSTSVTTTTSRTTTSSTFTVTTTPAPPYTVALGQMSSPGETQVAIACPSTMTLTGCSCYSDASLCSGSRIVAEQCVAYHRGGVGLIAAQCICAVLPHMSDFVQVESGPSWPVGTHVRASCAVGSVLLSCQCFSSTHDCTDGSNQIILGECFSPCPAGGTEVQSQAVCAQIVGSSDWQTVSGVLSSTLSSVTCPLGYQMTGCSCYTGATGGCTKGAKAVMPYGDVHRCEAYGGGGAKQMQSAAVCGFVPRTTTTTATTTTGTTTTSSTSTVSTTTTTVTSTTTTSSTSISTTTTSTSFTSTSSTLTTTTSTTSPLEGWAYYTARAVAMANAKSTMGTTIGVTVSSVVTTCLCGFCCWRGWRRRRKANKKALALEKEQKHVTFQDNPLKMMDLDGDGIVTNAEFEMFLSNAVVEVAQHNKGCNMMPKGTVKPNDKRLHGSPDSLTTDCGNDVDDSCSEASTVTVLASDGSPCGGNEPPTELEASPSYLSCVHEHILKDSGHSHHAAGSKRPPPRGATSVPAAPPRQKRPPRELTDSALADAAAAAATGSAPSMGHAGKKGKKDKHEHHDKAGHEHKKQTSIQQGPQAAWPKMNKDKDGHKHKKGHHHDDDEVAGNLESDEGTGSKALGHKHKKGHHHDDDEVGGNLESGEGTGSKAVGHKHKKGHHDADDGVAGTLESDEGAGSKAVGHKHKKGHHDDDDAVVGTGSVETARSKGVQSTAGRGPGPKKKEGVQSMAVPGVHGDRKKKEGKRRSQEVQDGTTARRASADRKKKEGDEGQRREAGGSILVRPQALGHKHKKGHHDDDDGVVGTGSIETARSKGDVHQQEGQRREAGGSILVRPQVDHAGGAVRTSKKDAHARISFGEADIDIDQDTVLRESSSAHIAPDEAKKEKKKKNKQIGVSSVSPGVADKNKEAKEAGGVATMPVRPHAKKKEHHPASASTATGHLKKKVLEEPASLTLIADLDL